jgi:uncharacterized membrane protein YtjA (UPF0391 family)
MLRWAVVFLLIAIVAGILGFAAVAHAATTIAKALFGIFLVLFIGAVAIGVAIASRLMSKAAPRRPPSPPTRCPG